MSAVAVPARRTYLNASYLAKSWLLTTDHKRIAILYMISITLMFFVGGVFATIMRLELLSPTPWLVLPETYNKLFTMHGVVMVWFFLIPSIPAVLGNFLVPLMVGAKDVAFPRLNLLSWYIYIVGVIFLGYTVVSGGVDTGWTFYTPFSTDSSTTNVLSTTLGIFIVGFSSILTGLNFIVTIHKMRAPGLTWSRLPLFIWSIYATSLILVLATPELGITLLMVIVERVTHVGIFDPKLGGDPLLFQHMFWFYSHPAVYIMILPGMGVVSECIATFARKRPFGYPFIAGSSMAIAIFGFLVWGHHLFVAGESVNAALLFSALSYMVAIPSAVKVFNWSFTLWGGSISFKTPMLYALGFIGLFTVGGITGLWVAALAFDVHVHDTYFVIAHFHYIMVGGMVLAYMGGIHYWWPKITGRMYPEWWGRISALIIFLGFNLTFFPQFILGYLGMPRRYAVYPPEFQVLNVASTLGASILALGYVLPLFYLIPSLWRGPLAPANPWGATGLEWKTPSPPPSDNFAETPVVTHEAYDFHALQAAQPAGLPSDPEEESVVEEHVAVAAHEPDPALAHHFATLEQQHSANVLGMWVFLATEVMLFGGMFLAYTVFSIIYPGVFEQASQRQNLLAGSINTGVLIISSLMIALAVRKARLGSRTALVAFLGLAALLGIVFLCIKGLEYYQHFQEQLVPGIRFAYPGPDADKVALFFFLYFVMTGVHAIHLTIGVCLVLIVMLRARRGHFLRERFTGVELLGLYWHFIDVIWIFLFPMLYLIASH